MLRYRTRSGTTRRPKIGEYPTLRLTDARAIARELLARVSLGEDPSDSWKKQRDQLTIDELCDEYVERHVVKLNSYKSVMSSINKYIKPQLGRYKIDEVTSTMVQAMHGRIAKRVPIQANRVIRHLSNMMSLAERWGYSEAGSNPCQHIEMAKENKRYRYMRPEEAKLIADGMKDLKPDVRATIRLLMLTGARRGEFAGRVLNREGTVAILGDHKTGRNKFIRLPDAAVALIEQEELDGKLLPAPATITRAWTLLCKRVGVTDLHIHDLRHTFASVGLSGGIPLGVIGQLLGHSNAQSTARYAHLVDDAGNHAVNLAADGIEKMLAGE